MFVRYKLWKQLTLHQVKKVEPYNLPFIFTQESQGVTDVTHQRSLEFILSEPDFELAYERYGVAFNERGFEYPLESSSPAFDVNPEVETTPKKRGRPAKV